MKGRRRRTKKEVNRNLANQLRTKYEINDNKCWVWTGLRYENGYGRLSRHLPIASLHSRAHIASYQFYVGSINKGLFVCHTCDNKLCINPEHLWLGTNQDNQLDASRKGLLTKHWTEEKRKEQSQKYSGENNPMYGKRGKDAPAHGRIGDKHPMYGKQHTREAKYKISQGLKRHYEKTKGG